MITAAIAREITAAAMLLIGTPYSNDLATFSDGTARLSTALP
jgi:hypothetical protein